MSKRRLFIVLDRGKALFSGVAVGTSITTDTLEKFLSLGQLEWWCQHRGLEIRWHE